MDATEVDYDPRLKQVQPTMAASCRTRNAVFTECPHCGSALHAEHAHFKCAGCGWRDSCCD